MSDLHPVLMVALKRGYLPNSDLPVATTRVNFGSTEAVNIGRLLNTGADRWYAGAEGCLASRRRSPFRGSFV